MQGNEALPKPNKTMQANEKKTNEATQATAPASLPAITREETRKGIASHATALGCDAKKAVSGMELLLMFLMELQRQAVLPPDADLARGVAIASHFDANSSAMTKRLYEGSGTAPVDKIAAFAAMLSKPKA